ncbi:Retrovirus-related Pol polyprotein from transposon 17.6 [Stylophora pistillata]|uniref:RNA-directed DNA polymerase n=1 Tax=Stylophora pistillata TaxID=50429 RepID=A0A2B4RL60_STYPI|nr:Retrovirus-related Pol polyprotein from transposon 17.6 [Stylophora pistillata]
MYSKEALSFLSSTSYETASQQLKEIHQEEVSAISQANEKTPPPPIREREIRCKFCAKTHVWNKLKCPAWGKTCSKCGIQNHFAVACKTKLSPSALATSSKRPTPRHVRRPVHAVEDSDLDEYVTCVDVKKQVCAVEKPNHKDKLLAVMLLNGHPVRFQLDTGATVNILPEESLKEVYGEDSLTLLDNTEVTLVMYNKTKKKPIGKKRVQVVNPRNEKKKYSVEFIVVKGKGKPLLGLRASEQMQLISVVRQNIMALQTEEPSQSKTPLTTEYILEEYADVFRGEGKLEGDLHLEIDPNVPPVQLPTRKVPIVIKEKLKEEMDHLEGLKYPDARLNGCKAIADDILVFGCGTNHDEAVKDYDDKLIVLLQRCREKGVRLNREKLQLRLNEVAYMGHMLSANGLQPDPEEVKAIKEMPAPTDEQSIQRLLGMTNYLLKFAPRLSEVTSPLRELTKNDNEFHSDEQVYGAALDETMKILSTTPVLKYFDPSSTPTLQCDASMHGLGACLMQDGHPVAYASRSLTPTEVHYAQVVKELLAIVFGVEKFETYLYGRKVLVQPDDKPLVAIFKKSLLNASKRLQRMFFRLQRYEFEVSYRKGTSLLMADPLSHAYLTPKEATEDQDDVMTVSDTRSPTEIKAEQMNMLQYLPVKDETLRQIQNLTQEDAILKTLACVIKQGWPESKLSPTGGSRLLSIQRRTSSPRWIYFQRKPCCHNVSNES